MLIENIVSLVKENPPPTSKKNSNRGRKPIHSWEKLVCICILMVVFGSTYRDIQNIVPSLNLPWNNEPYPDHTWISRTFKKIPLIYLERVLIWSAYLCLKESGWKKGILASDSTGVETNRYGYEVRFIKNSSKKFEKIRVKQYLKWHITGILDHLIILNTRLTSKKTHDSPVLRTMLNRLKKYRLDFAGSTFNGDRGYDGNKNFQSVFNMNMLPNIKQRKNSKNKNSSSKKNKYRKKAAKIFNASIYRYRGLIEGIFGAEETKRHHQLYCTFRLKNNQKRFGLIKSIGWNLEVLNRLQCANKLGIKVTPYAISN